MKILETRDLAIPEVKVVAYARFPDERGYFSEAFRGADLLATLGVPDVEIRQVNESYSRAGVVRGLHAQWNPHQGKLVRPLNGRLIDLALDLRKGSPFFGKVVAHEMPASPETTSAEWIWLPPGFAHGAVFPEDTTIEYLCTSVWSPGCEVSISLAAEDLDWTLCDPELRERIRQQLDGPCLMNKKDRAGLSLAGWVADPNSEWFVHSPGWPFDLTSRV